MRTKFTAPIINIVPKPIIDDMEMHHNTIGINAILYVCVCVCVCVREGARKIEREGEGYIYNP